jgi:hypothetical protein
MGLLVEDVGLSGHGRRSGRIADTHSRSIASVSTTPRSAISIASTAGYKEQRTYSHTP